MKRSHEPPFWMLFGAGGMLAALVGPALVFVIAIALPLGWLPEPMSDHARVRAALGHPLGMLGVTTVIALFLFHGCHRLLHSLHDLGAPRTPLLAMACYGFATACSVATVAVLLAIRGGT
jgi:fumarate reductase subunit D